MVYGSNPLIEVIVTVIVWSHQVREIELEGVVSSW